MIHSVLITAYCLCALCVNPIWKGITKSGARAESGVTAACGEQLYGKVIHIEGFGVFFCEDTGRLVKGYHVDIFMPTHEEAKKVFTRRTVTIIGDWRNGTVGDR